MDHVFMEGLTNPKKNGKRTVEINLASNFFSFCFTFSLQIYDLNTAIVQWDSSDKGTRVHKVASMKKSVEERMFTKTPEKLLQGRGEA